MVHGHPNCLPEEPGRVNRVAWIVLRSCQRNLAQVPALPRVASLRNVRARMTWASSSEWRARVRLAVLWLPNCLREGDPASETGRVRGSFLRIPVSVGGIARALEVANDRASFPPSP
jgi:hypothetical protein